MCIEKVFEEGDSGHPIPYSHRDDICWVIDESLYYCLWGTHVSVASNNSKVACNFLILSLWHQIRNILNPVE